MVSTRLTELRNRMGFSQAYIAQQLNITHQAYSLYETNKRQMNYETLCMLADIYRVSTDYLLGRENAVPSFLTEKEREIVMKYASLDERGKKSVEALIDVEYAHGENTQTTKKSAM